MGTVESVSFSAHADYKQTSGFIRKLKPPQVVLVHGEANEMSRLKAALLREYEAEPNREIEVHNPRNTVSVELYFRGEKMAKVMGSLAMNRPSEGLNVSGILVKRNFNYHLLAPGDLPKYTHLTMSTVTQRQSIFYSGTLQLLQYILQHTAGEVECVEGEGDKKRVIRAFGAIDIIYEPRLVTLEWIASPCNDMFADAVLSAVLQAESLESPRYLPPTAKVDKMHFKECLIELLQDMFGEESVPKIFSGDHVTVSVDNKQSVINLASLEVTCAEDATFQQIVQTAVSKLHQSLVPLQFDK